MSRRPKLSLVSNRELKKKQALDFSAPKASEKEPDRDPEAEQIEPVTKKTNHEPFRPVRLVSEQEKTKRQQGNVWPDGKLLLKAAVVVVTFALSVYLLKRRFL